MKPDTNAASKFRCRLAQLIALAGMAGCLPAAPPDPPPPTTPPAVRQPAARAGDEPVVLAAPATNAVFREPRPYRPAVTGNRRPAWPGGADPQRAAEQAGVTALTDAQRALLQRQGMAVLPVDTTFPDEIYQQASAQGLPVYVTADMALLAAERVHQDTLRRLVAGPLTERLTRLTVTLLARSEEQYRQVTGAEWQLAARHNAAWLAVAAGLLGLEVAVAPATARLVTAEQALMSAAAEERPSPIQGYLLDYRQFAPPAVLPQSETMARFAAALAWFHATPLATTRHGERGTVKPDWLAVRRLALLCAGLAAGPEAPLSDWEAISEPLAWLTGDPLALGPREVLVAAEEVWTSRRSLRDLDDFAQLRQFTEALTAAMPAPVVRPAPRRADEPGPVRCHLLGPPADLDLALLGEILTAGDRRVAGGLQLLAVLGAPRAWELTERAYFEPSRFPRHAAALRALAAACDTLEPADWRRNLERARFWACAPLSEVTSPPGRATGWSDRAVAVTLAAWTLGRAPQVTSLPSEPTLLTTSPAPADPPPGQVEPVPEVFARLGWLSATTTDGLHAHELGSENIDQAHARLRDFLRFCQAVAEDQLQGIAPSPDARARLATIGHELRWLQRGLDDHLTEAEQRPATVAQVPLGPADERLHLAVGPVGRIDVLVTVGDQLHLCRGATLTYQEWSGAAAPPLTTATWHNLLAEGTAPGLPEWTASYIVPNRLRPTLPQPSARPVGTAP